MKYIRILLAAVLALSVLAVGAAAESGETGIVFSEAGVEISGVGATAEGSTVTISDAGVYRVSGASGDANICVLSEGVTLILDGADLSRADGSVIECAADSCLIRFEGKSTLTASGATAVSASGDLAIEGTGEMEITSLSEAAVTASGTLSLGGDIRVNTSPAELREDGASITDQPAAYDPFQDFFDSFFSDPFGAFPYQTQESAAPALSAGKLQIENGAALSVSSCGVGLLATDSVTVSDGANVTLETQGSAISAGGCASFGDCTITIDSASHGIEAEMLEFGASKLSIDAAGYGVAVTGNYKTTLGSGVFLRISTGMDGFYSAENVVLSGGTLLVSGENNALLAGAGELRVESGTFLGFSGASYMTESMTSGQGQCVMSFLLSRSRFTEADTVFRIENNAGEGVLTYLVPDRFRFVVFSSDLLRDDDEYSMLLGGTPEGEAQMGLYESGCACPGAENIHTFVPAESDVSNGNREDPNAFPAGDGRSI